MRLAPERQSIVYLAPWKPVAEVSHPGDEVEFEVRRQTWLHGRDEIAIRTEATWINIETGKAYGTLGKCRLITKEGVSSGIRGVDLPAHVPPGAYYVFGWAETKTARLPSIATFRSDPITVTRR